MLYSVSWKSLKDNFFDTEDFKFRQYDGCIKLIRQFYRTGELSSNYKTLITFNGTRTQTRLDLSVGGGSDVYEYRLMLHDVPMEVGETDLIAHIQGNAQKYVTSAYWRHTTINPSANVTSETADLDFSDPNTELNVTFTKEY